MLFAVGHFLTALAQWFLKPRWTLLLLYTGAILFSILCMNGTGYTGISMGLSLSLFLGGIYGTTFSICVRGMAEHTKTAAAILVTATTGGAPFPIIQNRIHENRTAQYSFCVMVALCSAGAIFPLYLNFVSAARKQVDPTPSESGCHCPHRPCKRWCGMRFPGPHAA
jgi:fucose permease